MRVEGMQAKGNRPGDVSATPGSQSASDFAVAVDRGIFCARCATRVSHPDAVFRMDPRGPVAAFANPAGFLRRIVTVRVAESLTFAGDPTTNFTWFPGYAWTVALCATCGGHLGWRYDAVSGATPLRFYGLVTEAVHER